MTTTPAEKLSPSLEDYIEAILLLVRQGRVARVRDIASHLNVGMPSVTAALKTLAKRKLVNYDPYQYVTLSELGAEAAEAVSHRHDLLRRFLVDVLGLPGEAAEANACRMEHAVDAALLGRLRLFTEFMDRQRIGGENWSEMFRRECGDEFDR